MNTSSYLFLGSENIKHSQKSYEADIGYPRPINNDWSDLPIEFQRHIDDVINLNGFLYFFKGSQYLKFDIAKAKVTDGPKPIIEEWPGLTGTEFENGIDAATEWSYAAKTGMTDIICFFKGSDCIDYTVSSHTISKKTIADRWGITEQYSEFSENLDAAILWTNIGSPFLFLFKDNSNIRVNLKSNTIDGQAPIGANWRGVTFKRVQAAMSIDMDLLGSEIGNDSNTNTYFFLNSENIKYNDPLNNIDTGYPQPIRTNWPNLPIEFQRHIDDVINLNGCLYFFKGSQYLKFDIAKAQVIDGPKPIIEGWPGLAGTEFENGIDAATEWIDTKRDIVCFFKGKECINYTVSSHTIDQKTIAERWRITGEYAKFSANLDAAILWRNTGYFIYLFKGNEYLRLHLMLNSLYGKPELIQTKWKGVTFNKIQAAVSVDPDVLGSDINIKCGGTCGINNTGKHCFQLPQSIRFGLTAYVNSDAHQQTINVYIDDRLVDTLTGKGISHITDVRTYTSGTGKVCIEIIGDGKPSKLRYAYNTLEAKPGSAIIGANNGSNDNYDDSVVVLNWPLS
ncbi:photopexin PpxA [Photorhabdus aegyptia]|uniref:photopexin PpxA n=1 Tax=Photorhabdus aegyptia TaxID=2805098 RepID=UPI00226C560C|nr:photopexin PpxA [Photorhabdus aegyptia]